MAVKPNTFRELRISVAQNGFLVFPRDHTYSAGDMADCYVFATVEQLAGWMLKQKYALAEVSDD